jgi:branched-chain amino acid transport system permease protein
MLLCPADARRPPAPPVIRRLLPPLLLLALAGCAWGRGPEGLCRALLPGLVSGSERLAVTTRSANQGEVRVVTLDWPAPAAGEPAGRLTCRFLDRRAEHLGWRLAAAESSEYGPLSSTQLMLLTRGLRLPAFELLEDLAPPLAARGEAWPLGKSLAYFLQQTLNGLTVGSTYALIAFGYTMVYGITGIINFAFGELYMIGAFGAAILFLLLSGAGLGLPATLALSLVISMALTAGYGLLADRLLYRPMLGASRLTPLIAAIGLSIALQEYVRLLQGTHVVFLPPLLNQGHTAFESGGFALRVTAGQLLLAGTAGLLMLALWWLIAGSRFGRAQRACAEDRIMAAMLGIDVGRTVAATFMLGAALAAAGGTVVALYYGGVEPYMGYIVGFKALTAALLGGIGSLAGAALGGLAIGLFEAYWAGYLDTLYRDVAVFAVLILVLTFRPNGLTGRGVDTRLTSERI